MGRQAQASSTGSGIGLMPTQTSSRPMEAGADLWKRENNVPLMSLNYHEKAGPTPNFMNASSTILQAFFTPHAQHERGKVIGCGVHIYIYIYMFVNEKNI